MSTTIPRKVIEGTPSEIKSFVEDLPPLRYHVEITEPQEQKAEIDPLEEAIRRWNARTPEQVQADREEVLAGSKKPRPLPPGKTLDDMVRGKWPGDETDEQIQAALEELS